jgi:ankyrin repeat protein
MKMTDDWGNLPIHLAARNNNVLMCDHLLKEPDISFLLYRNKPGKNACHEASGKGHCEIIQHIYMKEPTVLFERDEDGLTCLHMAAAKG